MAGEEKNGTKSFANMHLLISLFFFRDKKVTSSSVPIVPEMEGKVEQSL